MKIKLIILTFLLAGQSFAQTPIVYVNFVSHNEPADNLQNLIPFTNAQSKVVSLAAIMNLKGASWNLQTCDGFANGAFAHETVVSNIFRTLATPPNDDHVEIDPRNKNITNIADLYWLLDTLGANPTNTLGGFFYSDATGTPDWFQYQDSIQAPNHPEIKWKCNLMWGAGSLNHVDDLNDYGIWKPDSVTASRFYSHNSDRSIWFIGNGCQPLQALDSLENEQTIISNLKNFVDSIQNTILPQNKFYSYSITINQSHFGPTLFQKIITICDSINDWGTSKIQWATLTEKFNAFQLWQTASGHDYSQWQCGQTATSITEKDKGQYLAICPNPAQNSITLNSENWVNKSDAKVNITNIMGEILIQSSLLSSSTSIDISSIPPGLYMVQIENGTNYVQKFIKQ